MVEHQIKATLADFFAVDIAAVDLQPVAGGDTHQCLKALIADKRYFIKTNSISRQSVLSSEYQSLNLIQGYFADCYPRAIAMLETERLALLVMEYRAISPLSESVAFEAGELLARQHQVTAPNFGWDEENFIGATAQLNQWCSNWSEFFINNRLLPQLELALRNGLPAPSADGVQRVIDELPNTLSHKPKPSLVHGDLWSGNIGESEGAPILFDPAPYFGDAEVDLAMSELFGGISDSFYRGYQTILPIQEGYQQRKNIYNLYHALNHFNLFGSGYVTMVNRFAGV